MTFSVSLVEFSRIPDKTVTLTEKGEEYKSNKYTIIYNWMSWSPEAIAFHPILISLYNQYKDKGLEVIAVNLLEYSRKYNVNHQMILIRFFHERLLYRVSISDYREHLFLKGGICCIHFKDILQDRQSILIFWEVEFLVE